MSEKAIRSRAYPGYFSSRLENYISLSKPRLLASVVLSAFLGFVLPMTLSNTVLQLIYLLFGTALMGGGANALNQWMEQVPDSIMNRTKNRVLPMGKLSEKEAMIFGIVISAAGFFVLWFGNNHLTAGLGLLTLLTYILVYTPLKQKNCYQYMVRWNNRSLTSSHGLDSSKRTTGMGSPANFCIALFLAASTLFCYCLDVP